MGRLNLEEEAFELAKLFHGARDDEARHKVVKDLHQQRLHRALGATVDHLSPAGLQTVLRVSRR